MRARGRGMLGAMCRYGGCSRRCCWVSSFRATTYDVVNIGVEGTASGWAGLAPRAVLSVVDTRHEVISAGTHESTWLERWLTSQETA